MLKENILKELHVWIKNSHRLLNASRRNLRSKQRIILSPMPNKHPVVVYIAVKWRWRPQRGALSQTSSQCPIIIIVCNIKLLTLISLKLYVKHRGCCSFFKLCASFFAAQWIYRQIQFFTSRCRLASIDNINTFNYFLYWIPLFKMYFVFCMYFVFLILFSRGRNISN